MEGLQNLIALPDDKKDVIATQFGGIGQLYRRVFDLYSEDYQLYATKPNGYQDRQKEIEKELFAIQDQLDEIGFDGHEITTDISSDHGEIIVKKHIQNQ